MQKYLQTDRESLNSSMQTLESRVKIFLINIKDFCSTYVVHLDVANFEQIYIFIAYYFLTRNKAQFFMKYLLSCPYMHICTLI